MPPKARIVTRKNSAISKNVPKLGSNVPAGGYPAKNASGNAGAKPISKEGSMLPPPDPLPPKAILEAETDALASSLRTAAVKTGQIYGFYADTQRLGIHHYAPQPPRSLSAALGREVERYDQLCDTMESQLLRAIAVLQRDLDRANAQLQAEAEAEALRNQPKPELVSPVAPLVDLPASAPAELPVPLRSPSSAAQTSTLPEEPVSPMVLTIPTPQVSPPTSAGPLSSARRHSTISLSSLNRPQFPHKLDLSAAALRINPEEISQGLGLASPVTLAPKSGRPNAADEFAPDFMTAITSSDPSRVDIDLTALPDTDAGGTHIRADPALGSSADRPIELDLDSMDIDISSIDLFGDDPEGNAETAVLLASAVPHQDIDGKKKSDDDLNMFGTLSGDTSTNGGSEVFTFGSASPSAIRPGEPFSVGMPGMGAPGTSAGVALSAGAILDSFNVAASGSNTSHKTNNNQASNGGDVPFDMSGLDFSSFSSTDQAFRFDGQANSDMNLLDNMDAFLNMEGVESGDHSHGNQSGS